MDKKDQSYLVRGTHGATGRRVRVKIAAPDSASAIQMATQMGIDVRSAEHSPEDDPSSRTRDGVDHVTRRKAEASTPSVRHWRIDAIAGSMLFAIAVAGILAVFLFATKQATPSTNGAAELAPSPPDKSVGESLPRDTEPSIPESAAPVMQEALPPNMTSQQGDAAQGERPEPAEATAVRDTDTPPPDTQAQNRKRKQKKPRTPPKPPARVPLTEQDQILLKSGCQYYFHNDDCVESVLSDNSLPFLVQEAQKNNSNYATFCGMIVVWHELNRDAQAMSKSQSNLIGQLPSRILGLAIESTPGVVLADGLADVFDFRDQFIRGGLALFQALRVNKVLSQIGNIDRIQTSSNLARQAIATFGSRLGDSDLSNTAQFDVTPFRLLDGRKLRRHGKPWLQDSILANGMLFKYEGATELTNVLITYWLDTTGICVQLTAGQRQAQLINASMASEEELAAVDMLFKTDNILDSIPHGGYAFLTSVSPGDRIHCLAGSGTSREKITRLRYEIRCDQGRIPEHELEIEKPPAGR